MTKEELREFRKRVVRLMIHPSMCPRCGASEEHPWDEKAVLIRALKVFDEKGAWSQCLVCSGHYELCDLMGFYDKQELVETPENHCGSRGWFCS